MKNLSVNWRIFPSGVSTKQLTLILGVALAFIEPSVFAMDVKTLPQVDLQHGIEDYSEGRYHQAYGSFVNVIALGSQANAQQQATAARYLAAMNNQRLVANNSANRENMMTSYMRIVDRALDEETRTDLQHNSSVARGVALLQSDEFEKARLCFEIVAHSTSILADRIEALNHLIKMSTEGFGAPQDPDMADFYMAQAIEASAAVSSAVGAANTPSDSTEKGSSWKHGQSVETEKLVQPLEKYDSFLRDFNALMPLISQFGRVIKKIDDASADSELKTRQATKIKRAMNKIVEHSTILALKFASFNEITRDAIVEQCPALFTLNKAFQDQSNASHPMLLLEDVLSNEVTDILPLVTPGAFYFMKEAMKGIKTKKLRKEIVMYLYLLDYFLTKGEWEEAFAKVELNKDAVMAEGVILLAKCLLSTGNTLQTPQNFVDLEALKASFQEYKNLTQLAVNEGRTQLQDFLLVEYERLEKAEKDTLDAYLAREGINLQELRNESEMLAELLERIDSIGRGKLRHVNDSLMLALAIFVNDTPCEARFLSSLLQLINKKLCDSKKQALIGSKQPRKALSIQAATTYVLFKTVEHLAHKYNAKLPQESKSHAFRLPFTLDILEAFESQKKEFAARKKQKRADTASQKKELDVLCTAELSRSESGCIYLTVTNGKGPFTCSIDSAAPIASSSRTFSVGGLTPGKKHILITDTLKNVAELEVTIPRPTPAKLIRENRPAQERLLRAQAALIKPQQAAQGKQQESENAHAADVERMAREERARQESEKAHKERQTQNAVLPNKLAKEEAHQAEENAELAQLQMLHARELEMKRFDQEEQLRLAQKKAKRTGAAARAKAPKVRSVSITGETSGNRLIINSNYDEHLEIRELIEKLDVEQPSAAFPPSLQRRVLSNDPTAALQVLNLYGDDPKKIAAYTGMSIEQLRAVALRK